jgi:hypothetical protein
VVDVSAYRLGRDAARGGLPIAGCPFRAGSIGEAEWERGWIRENSIRKYDRPASRSGGGATVIPHPAMSAAECELLCRREGLALAHLGRARLVLVQTSAPRDFLASLGIALRRDRRPDPEAA